MAEPVQQGQIAVLRKMGGLVFDATFEETHESELVVTDNPVETGVIVSDHAYMAPRKLILTAGVSDISLRGVNSQDAFSSDSSGRARRAFEVLAELQKLAEPFEVQTGLTLYRNMICTHIRTVQDKDSSGVFIFTATLREVIITFTEVTGYPPRKAGATRRQSSAPKQRGEQQSKEIDRRSLILKGRDVLRGLL